MSDSVDEVLGGRVALVTGASRGIGRAVAIALARRGARIAIHYRSDRQGAETTLAELAGEGHGLFAADLSMPARVRDLARSVDEEMGPVGVLVNNAGVYEVHPFDETDWAGWLDVWERTLGTNLLGPAHLSFAVARTMVRNGGGRIVNVSSRGAFRGEPEAPAYGASKAGLNALGQSLAKALAPHGVLVFGIAPGYVATDMVEEIMAGPEGDAIRRQSPLNRIARPEEIARTVAFLASEAPEFLTGCIVDANGASYLRT